MNQDERLDYLVNILRDDSIEYKNLKVEKENRRNVLRSLMNIRMPREISKEFLKIQDEFLCEEAIEKGIVKAEDIKNIKDEFNSRMEFGEKICVWQGDITTIAVDAIVNAANSQMLGCFVPCHRCIDNAIHSAAGIELRDECNKIMEKQGYEEPTGSAKITSAYNLPCKYVIHTVGPIVYGELTDDLKNELRSCYKSCLKIAIDNNVRSIAFCCISTGEFHFPNDEAAKIAVETVNEFLKQQGDKIDKVIFNVFKDYDLEIYKSLL